MNASEPKRRWFYPTPAWLVLLSLATTSLLFVSQQYRWFAFNHHKGWTVLIALASVGVVLVIILVWWLAALLFRWRFQFSIRSLLVLVVAVALPCGWLAVEMKKEREQAKAVEAIRTIGFALYDWEGEIYKLLLNGASRPNTEPPGAAWLRNILGDNFFAQVVAVEVDRVTTLYITGAKAQRG